MVSIYEVSAQKLAKEVASVLEQKEEMKAPEWSAFVKTGVHNERPPAQENWWYVRSASVLRTIYKDGPIGVSKLRSKYGGKKNRGRKPEKFKKGSGSIIRKILQQLETAGLVQKAEGQRKGRVATPAGLSLLNKAANKVAKEPVAKQTSGYKNRI